MMNYAYDDTMIDSAEKLMGSMLDFSVYGMGYELNKFYSKFIQSEYSNKVERGDSRTIMGMSGIELAMEIVDSDDFSDEQMDRYVEHAVSGRSVEYWTGWALAQFQWETSLSFSQINSARNIIEVSNMYMPYHEMDISRFCDDMRLVYKEANKETQLQKMRKNAGFSQKLLSDISGVPLRTIQQYEQRQKNINHAKVDYLVSLSRSLSCDIEMLIEKV